MFAYVGDPVTTMLGQDFTEARRAALVHQLGLDQPFFVQYAKYFWAALHGVFGLSYRLEVRYLGRIVEMGPGETIFRAPHHPYTRLLLDAVPDLEMVARARRRAAKCRTRSTRPRTAIRAASWRQRASGEEKPAHRALGEVIVPGHAAPKGRIG